MIISFLRQIITLVLTALAVVGAFPGRLDAAPVTGGACPPDRPGSLFPQRDASPASNSDRSEAPATITRHFLPGWGRCAGTT